MEKLFHSFGIEITDRYLHFPVSNKDRNKTIVRIYRGDLFLHSFNLVLDMEEPDFYAYLDLKDEIGCELNLQLSGEVVEKGFDSGCLIQSESIISLYPEEHEKHRPVFHFTSHVGWLNDPNGLIHYNGQYHLFYQHNPYGTRWGNMHWGHAVSEELFRWKERGEALYPDNMGTMYSGCGVMDTGNVSGLGTESQLPLLLFYTAAGGIGFAPDEAKEFTVCIAFSLDEGESWEKYSGNPVLDWIVDENRDPKVIWHSKSGKWIMGLYLKDRDYRMFESSDLVHWSPLLDYTIFRTSECPDIMLLNDDNGTEKCVIWGADAAYVVGEFDGNTFSPETGVEFAHIGCGYAGQTFFQADSEDRRVIGLSWLRDKRQPEAKDSFGQCMSCPLEYRIVGTRENMRLIAEPVEEILGLRGECTDYSGFSIGEGKEIDFSYSAVDMELRVELPLDGVILITVGSVEVRIDCKRRVLHCGQYWTEICSGNGEFSLRLLADKWITEVFCGGKHLCDLGEKVEDYRVRIRAVGCDVVLEGLEVYSLSCER